jgi:outer membrane cobalamin receptor
MARANPKHLLEDAEMRVQRGQRRLDHQRSAVAVLERADQDATQAKRVLKILEKALAVHVADRDRLAKRLARQPR